MQGTRCLCSHSCPCWPFRQKDSELAWSLEFLNFICSFWMHLPLVLLRGDGYPTLVVKADIVALGRHSLSWYAHNECRNPKFNPHVKYYMVLFTLPTASSSPLSPHMVPKTDPETQKNCALCWKQILTTFLILFSFSREIRNLILLPKRFVAWHIQTHTHSHCAAIFVFESLLSSALFAESRLNK